MKICHTTEDTHRADVQAMLDAAHQHDVHLTRRDAEVMVALAAATRMHLQDAGITTQDGDIK